MGKKDITEPEKIAIVNVRSFFQSEKQLIVDAIQNGKFSVSN